uniref:Uncharacterized protein n=1 Tax=Rhizophora mucronata TaxID=61149 RepID=A0A2P2PHS7_RHIMU
MQFTTLPS